ncbi:MAG TPA: ATP synthase F1 subunit epsilon [Patescibacteria group bacterium]|nr:ATP synthase F1 subunit epsilon [Patescibacteria group bacterium]
MLLKLITPERTIFEGEIEELIVPTTTGELSILPHHMNLVTQVSDGEITIKAAGKTQHIAVTQGFLEIQHDTASLLADFAVRSDEINMKEVLDAQKRAEDMLKTKRDDITERDFEAAMKRAMVQIKVANKRHKHNQLGPKP